MTAAVRLQTVTIDFDAEPAGPAPLTWAQLAIWDVLRWLPSGDDSLNQIGWVPVPPEADVETVVGALRSLLERHDSLRSVYVEVDGAPTQRVRGSGTLALQLRETTETDVGAAADASGQRLKRGAFDVAVDLPVRAELVLRGGAPWVLVLVLSHMSVDGWSFHVVKSDLVALLSGHGPALPPRGRQPVDRAVFESTPEGLVREQRTLDHWNAALQVASATMLERPPGPEAVAGEWARIDSAAAAAGAAALSDLSGVNPGTVVLASLALLLAFRVDEPRATLRVIVTPRFTAADRHFVGAFNQNALLHVEIDEGESLVGFLRRVGSAALAAYRRCEANPRTVEGLVAEVAERRGIVPDGYCFFNDVRFAFDDRAAAPAGDPAAAVDTVLERLHKDERQKGSKLFLYLQELGPRCRMTVCLDPAFLGDYGATTLLSDLEDLMSVGASAPDGTVGTLRHRLSVPSPLRAPQPEKETDATWS